ncbi:MAG: SDR family NAD(P)-dependent oxidoreductase, partial [candidate division NC10 bacterium]|nr:SDR family NAD(P)-dependent oxidoreductase [candidate division NC10 bacterium]
MNWKSKHVLVTGAGGFIGSHLAEQLVNEGARVRAFVHYNALGGAGWLDDSPLSDQMEIFAGDICDRDSVRSAMRGTEVIFHLAALIGIPYSYHAPASYVRTNIEGTLNILQAARDLNVQRVIHTSTSEVYGTACFVPITEEHPLQGQSPYSASKIGADKLADAFHFSFGLPVVTLRPFNTFGPRQSARAVIPTIVTQCLAGETVRLGNLHPTRDLNFVDNTVEGYLLAATVPGAIGKTI